MILKNFLFFSMAIIAILLQFIGVTITNYKAIKESGTYSSYTDYAKLVLAVKTSIKPTLFFSKYVIPISLWIDIIILCVKHIQ